MIKPTVLALDDESDNLDALERIFRKTYRFLRANSGLEALEILSHEPRIDVIITDQRMPQMTGVEFLEKTLHTHPRTVRILLTGYTDIDSIVAAVNQGHIFRYITKPWETTDLVNSVEQAMQYYARGEELEIKNQALEKALTELKTLDEAKNKFMILINHELKTPLTVIQSFLGLLQETKLSEDQQIYSDRIKKSSNRLQEIIDDTLIVSRFTAGVLKLNQQSTSMLDWLQSLQNEFTKDFQTELQKKNLSIKLVNKLNLKMSNSTSQDSSNIKLNLDTNLFKRALHHLLNNAIKFASPETEISLTLSRPLKDKNSNSPNTIAMSVENEGPPFPTSWIKEIETPFKLQSEIMNHSKGLGLGMSVINAITQAHQGQIQIENTPLNTEGNLYRVTVSIILN